MGPLAQPATPDLEPCCRVVPTLGPRNQEGAHPGHLDPKSPLLEFWLESGNHCADAAVQAPLQAAQDLVEGLRSEAAKARAMAERHQEMVASLTADNLMFVMRLKHCEGELLSAGQERDELRLAVDEQKGPWFDEVTPPSLPSQCHNHNTLHGGCKAGLHKPQASLHGLVHCTVFPVSLP